MKHTDLVEEYLKTLTDKELLGYQIASSHLGSAFHLEKSIGFVEWLQNRNETEKTP
jgi:hypothetical protein